MSDLFMMVKQAVDFTADAGAILAVGMLVAFVYGFWKGIE